jgi:hypothetical protein
LDRPSEKRQKKKRRKGKKGNLTDLHVWSRCRDLNKLETTIVSFVFLMWKLISYKKGPVEVNK